MQKILVLNIKWIPFALIRDWFCRVRRAVMSLCAAVGQAHTLHQTHKGSFCSTAVLFLIRRSNEPSQSCRSVPAVRRMQAGCRTTRLMLLNYSVILESNYTKLAFASSTSIPHQTALNCKRCTKHDFLCKVISCLYLAINITFLCYIYLST